MSSDSEDDSSDDELEIISTDFKPASPRPSPRPLKRASNADLLTRTALGSPAKKRRLNPVVAAEVQQLKEALRHATRAKEDFERKLKEEKRIAASLRIDKETKSEKIDKLKRRLDSKDTAHALTKNAWEKESKLALESQKTRLDKEKDDALQKFQSDYRKQTKRFEANEKQLQLKAREALEGNEKWKTANAKSAKEILRLRSALETARNSAEKSKREQNNHNLELKIQELTQSKTKIVEDVAEILECPVCLDGLPATEPHLLGVGCGHVLCRAHANQLANQGGVCPLCRAGPLNINLLRPASTLDKVGQLIKPLLPDDGT